MTPDRPLPSLAELSWDQSMGRACIWCNRLLTFGAVEAGVIREKDGAHVLDTTVWVGPCCAGPATT